MTSRISHQFVLTLILMVILVAGCAQPRVYQRAVPLTPAVDTTPGSWEEHAARVLTARGYEVVPDGPGDRARGERVGDDGTTDIVRVWRSSEPYAAGAYTHRFVYKIRASATNASRSITSVGPSVRADVDSVVAALEALRIDGVPPWVGRLTCAMNLGIKRGFYLGIDNRRYSTLWSPAVKLASPSAREHAGRSSPNREMNERAHALASSFGALWVELDSATTLRLTMMPWSRNEVVALRDTILQRCDGVAHPRPTEASASE